MNRYYKQVLLDGCAIEYKQASLCLINDYSHRIPTQQLYQVHSDNRKALVSEFFKDPDRAVDKFLQIKGKIG